MTSLHPQLVCAGVQTPALVLDVPMLLQALSFIPLHGSRTRLELLFPLKALAIVDILEGMADYLEGFTTSSLFEAKLARETLGSNGHIHFSAPAISEDEIDEIAYLCDQISFNSLSQLARFSNRIEGDSQMGLRINTELSFVTDERYDPCRRHSKLGVPLSQLREALNGEPRLCEGVRGLLVHTNCESEDFGEVLQTVEKLKREIPAMLEDANWINLGGGYLFDESTDWTPFMAAVRLLQDEYNLDVFFEPGKGIISEAGVIVTSVLDITESGGKKVAVLDTSVNHMPEVFEYQYRPQVAQEKKDGRYSYILAGATCLAGDLFGEYCFEEPLEIGSRLVFEDMGAYTLVKATMFNGINLPSLWVITEQNELKKLREFNYEDFLSRCGVNRNAIVREININPKAR